MKKKKLLSVVLSAILVCSSIITYGAPTKIATSENIKIQQIEKNYPNVKISNVSMDDIKGHQVILANSPEEYEQLLRQFSNIGSQNTPTQIVSVNSTNNLSTIRAYSSKSTSGSALSDVQQTPIGCIPAIPPVNMNIQFHYDYRYNSNLDKYTFTDVYDVKSWLTGIQIPVAYSWEQKNESVDYTNSKTECTTTVNGVLGTTIIYKGFPKIIEQNLSFSMDWTLPQNK